MLRKSREHTPFHQRFRPTRVRSSIRSTRRSHPLTHPFLRKVGAQKGDESMMLLVVVSSEETLVYTQQKQKQNRLKLGLGF